MKTIADFIDQPGLDSLNRYREKLFLSVTEDGHKHDCGQIEVVLPSYSNALYGEMDEKSDTGDMWLHVRCYRFGEGRSHYYTGKTLLEVVEKADKQLSDWINGDD